MPFRRPPTRALLQGLLLGAVLLTSGRAAAAGPDIRFARVWPQYREADEFKGVTEYRTGREQTGGWTILRTKAADRAGYYFLIRTETTPGGAGRPGHFIIHVVTPDSPEPRVFEIPAEIPAGSHVFQLGLTGADWKGKHVNPVAWKVEFAPEGGGAVVGQASFLWEKPSA